MCYFSHFWVNDGTKQFVDFAACGNVVPKQGHAGWREITEVAEQNRIRTSGNYHPVDMRNVLDFVPAEPAVA